MRKYPQVFSTVVNTTRETVKVEKDGNPKMKDENASASRRVPVQLLHPFNLFLHPILHGLYAPHPPPPTHTPISHEQQII